MLKRSLAALLSALTLLALCACSGQSAAPAADAAPAESDAAAPDAAPAESADAVESDAAAPADTPENPDAASESAWPLTVQDMIDANTVDKLAQTYGSMRADYERFEDDGGIVMQYADAEISYLNFSDLEYLLFLDGSSGYQRDGDIYAALLDFGALYPLCQYFTLDPTLTGMEELVNVEQDGETITLTTNISAEVFRPNYDEDEFPYADGDYFEEVYVLNASDNSLLSNVTTLVGADGTRTAQDNMTITYGAERPAEIEPLMARKNAADFRTGTVILDPGTPEERIATAKSQKGDPISVYLPEGYDGWYTDPECTVETEPPEEADYNADFTFYGVKSAEAE